MEVNYLHYGNALDRCADLERIPEQGIHAKQPLLLKLASGSAETRELIQAYGAKRSKRIDAGRFRLDLGRSLVHRRFFASLGCRGFSYRVEDEIEFCEPLRECINLRVALMPGEELFYPQRVKRYLRRVNSNHYFCDGYPSIAFALGTKTPRAWFIFVMQSDLALRGPSYIREHFRGWRKVLFANIVRMARGHAATIYLCRSEDVLRACHSSFRPPQRVPGSWEAIYNRTAGDFCMQLVEIPERVNIQLFPDQPEMVVDNFYQLPVGGATSRITS